MSDRQLSDWRNHAHTLETEVNKVVVGQQIPVRLITTSIFARGHVLLEGDVGVGKTTLLRAFTRGIGGGYQRIEGTIDLMPNDLVYHTYLGEDGKPHVSAGPLLMSGENLSVFSLMRLTAPAHKCTHYYYASWQSVRCLRLIKNITFRT